MRKILPAAIAVYIFVLAVPAMAEEWSGAHSSHAEFSAVVARTETEWRDLWADLSQSPPAALDSENQMGIAVFLGVRRTGGFAVRISAVEDGPVFFIVDVAENKPAEGAMVTQALTTPFIIRVVPKSDRPVAFRRAGAAAEHFFMPDREFERAQNWIVELWDTLQEARDKNQQLNYIIEEDRRQIEQLYRELRERCQPCGYVPSEEN